MNIVLTENLDHSWSVTKAVLEHFGHLVTKKEYYRHTQTRRIDKDEETYARKLLKTKALHTNVAACLTNKTGKEFTRKDINNLARKLSEKEEEPQVEAVLGAIQDAGGLVRYTCDS